jgi:hypothetical protein
MQPPSVSRIIRGHHNKLVMAAQASPLWCHGFCIPRQLCNEKNNPTRQHDGKNACHRDAAAAAHTTKRYKAIIYTLDTYHEGNNANYIRNLCPD